MTKVLTITPRQTVLATVLCVLAQQFMPAMKRFGLFIWGDSGIGKNAFTDDLASALSAVTKKSYSHYDFNCASKGPEDVAGLPYLDNGGDRITTSFAPFCDYNQMGEHGIFRLDEMDRPFDKAIIPALLKHVIDRTDDYVLPLGWFVIGVGNGCSDRDTVELSNHTKGRFVHVYASLNSDGARRDMESYLSERDGDPAIKALHRLTPVKSNDCFTEHALHQNRTVEYADCIIQAYRKYGPQLEEQGFSLEPILRPVLAGAIGVAAANEVIRLMDFDGLPTLGQITNGPETVEVPADLSLAVKFTSTLVDFVSVEQEALQLAKYFARFPNEVRRAAMEKLSTLWEVVKI